LSDSYISNQILTSRTAFSIVEKPQSYLLVFSSCHTLHLNEQYSKDYNMQTQSHSWSYFGRTFVRIALNNCIIYKIRCNYFSWYYQSCRFQYNQVKFDVIQHKLHNNAENIYFTSSMTIYIGFYDVKDNLFIEKSGLLLYYPCKLDCTSIAVPGCTWYTLLLIVQQINLASTSSHLTRAVRHRPPAGCR